MTHTLTPTGTWSPRPPLLTARAGLGVVTVNGQILAIGGFDAHQAYDVVEGRQVAGDDTWRELAAMPTARSNFAIAVLRERVYVMGGIPGGNRPLDVTEIYDPTSGTWTQGLPLPQARASAGAAVLNGLLYVAGGIVPAGGDNSSAQRSATMIVYDPGTNIWHSAAPMSKRRQALRLVAADGHLYAIGGMDHGPSLSTVERYDPEADSWQTMSPMRETRVRPSVVRTTIGGRPILVVVAGVEFSKAGKIVDGRRTTEIFDLDTNNWELLDALLPKVRGSHGGVLQPDGTILAIGGGTTVNGIIAYLTDVDELTLRPHDLP